MQHVKKITSEKGWVPDSPVQSTEENTGTVLILSQGEFLSYPQCGGSGMLIPDPESDFFPSRIPDPNCLHPGSRNLKELKYFNPKKSKENGF
jgi:hypothetical protein